MTNLTFPGRTHGTNLADIVASDRRDSHRKAKHIKCQASDMLSLLGVLGLYVQTVLLATGLANPACDALVSLISLTHLIVTTSRMEVSPARLLGAVHMFLEKYTAVFGFDCLIPKCHWLLHLPESLARFGRLLNCFVL